MGWAIKASFFFGDAAILNQDPLAFSLNFQGGSWQLYVAPKQGWSPHNSAVWPLRLAIIIICALLTWAFLFFLKMLDRQQKKRKNARNHERFGANRCVVV